MLTTGLKRWQLAAGVVLPVLVAHAAVAQCNATINLRSGTVLQGPAVGWGEARFWDGDGNETIAVGATGQMAARWDGTLMFQDIDVSGEDPIAGIVRASELQLIAGDLRWQLRSGSWNIAVNPGLEFVTGKARGTNTATGDYVDWGDDAIPTLGVICERTSGSWTWIINPKLAGWQGSAIATNEQLVEGFGTVIGIGVGVRKQLSDRWLLMADVTPIIAGDNSINEDTNQVERDVVWGVGASYLLVPAHNTWLTAFGSNAFGPTPATSLLAAPNNSICLGVRGTTTF